MITLEVEGLDWDQSNRAKCHKHGVSMPRLSESFMADPSFALHPKHSDTEDRLIAIGRTLPEGIYAWRLQYVLEWLDNLSDQSPLVTCMRRRSLLMKKAKKRVPRLKTDKAAEAFFARDLSNLDFSQLQPVRFEFEKKDKQINMRLPAPLLAALKAKAKASGIPYTRFIREALENAVSRSAA